MAAFCLHDDGYFEGGFSGCMHRIVHAAECLYNEAAELSDELDSKNAEVFDLYMENRKLREELAKKDAVISELMKRIGK